MHSTSNNSFIMNGLQYENEENEEEGIDNGEMNYLDTEDDDFMPHSWNKNSNSKSNSPKKISHSQYKQSYFENEFKADSDLLEQAETDIINADAPAMPMDFYNKIDSFLTKPAPVVYTGSDKPSGVSKLPSVASNNNKKNDINKFIGSKINAKTANAKPKKVEIDPDLVRQAFAFVPDMISDDEDMHDGVDKKRHDTTKSSGSGLATRKKKKTPEKINIHKNNGIAIEQQQDIDMSRLRGDISGGSNSARNELNAHGTQHHWEESADDLYTQLMKQHESSVEENTRSKSSGNLTNPPSKATKIPNPYLNAKSKSEKPLKKSHPYLSQQSNMKASSKGKTHKKKGGIVNRLRDELVDVTFTNNNNGKITNTETRENGMSFSSGIASNDSSLGQSSSNHSAEMAALIENFTKGLTFNKLQSELQDSKRSMERSNQFMSQLAKEMKGLS